MSRWGRTAVIVAGLIALSPSTVRAEFPDGFNHPDVKWLELETSHFVLVFVPGLESTARLAANILEEVHVPICDQLGVVPDSKTTVILADFDDVGFNNFARRLEHVIYISNPVMNQARVEREQWLRHLLAHEYVHVVNGWALRAAGRAVGPLIEWAGMELQPQWFTEGLAEYVSSLHGRTESNFVLQAAQQNQLLVGGKLDISDLRFDVIETSVVYKQGYSMCLYLAQKYGEDVFQRILDQYAHTPEWDIAFKIATDETVESFYHRWLQQVLKKAAERPAEEPLLKSTEGLDVPLEAALGARWSPDGKRLAVYGVPDWEDPIPALFLCDADGSHFTKIASNLDLYESWKFSFTPDGRYLVYCGRTKSVTGSVRSSFIVYDLGKRKSWRLNTGDLRLAEPEISPDGTRIAFASYHHERAMIATMNLDGSDVQYVTRELAEDCFSPSWSPDGAKLVFSVAGASGTDLAVIGVDGSGFRRLTNDPWPDQNPAWSPDGRTIAFISFRDAAGSRSEAAVSAEAEGLAVASTNLYLIPAAGGDLVQLTKATSGGCYFPAWSPDGQSLLFSLFQIRTAGIRNLQLTAIPAAVKTADATDPGGEVVVPSPVGSPTLPVALGPVAVQPSVLSSPAALPVAEAQAPAAGQGPGDQAGVRPYRSFERVKNYVTRPVHAPDGLGDAFGVRTRFTDPLQKHEILAEALYGTGASDQWTGRLAYLNDQTAFSVGASVFRRIPPVRGERGALVEEAVSGFELLAELPITVGQNAYSQDKVQFGYEWADHRPFGTQGGILRPAPVAGKIAGPSIGYSRDQILPGLGDQELSAKLTRSDRIVGADLDFWHLNVLYAGRFFAPTPRAKVAFAANVDYHEGDDLALNAAGTARQVVNQQWLLTSELRYDWRFSDQFLSKELWPYVHFGPSYLSASYQMRELMHGQAAGADLRDRFTLQCRNNGYLSRLATYEVAAGPTFYVDGGKTDWTLTLRLDWRNLPF